MRQIRCQRCRHAFTLSMDVVMSVLEEVDQQGLDYYMIECPKCRHAIKVPRADLERMRPR